LVPNLGREYIEAFESAYSAIAKARDPVFMPFFLKGVAGRAALNQADGIHPTPKGYQVLVDHLMPYVIRAIDRHGS
jgi:acyl-CoA thioesterase-1